jgi:hypothetical protein
MATLAELATERRAKLKKFSSDIYAQSASFDVSQLNEWIAKAPITPLLVDDQSSERR